MTQQKSAALVAKADQIQSLVDQCLTENTPEEFARAAEVVKAIKGYRKEVGAVFDEICDRAYKSWKASTNRRKEFTDPADKAEKAIKLKMARYTEWERKIQAEEFRKQQEEQRKAAEKQRLAEMEELAEAGAIDEAAHLAEQPLEIIPVAKAPETKAEGVSTSYKWYAEVTDKSELLKFCAGEKRWQHLVDENMKELNKLAVSQQDNFDIPGVEAKKKPVVSVRT